MSTVAVTGGTGRIGAPLVRALLASGHTVRALTRRPRPPMPGVDWIVGDLHSEVALAELVSSSVTVFHAAGQMAGDDAAVERSMVAGTESVLQAAKAVRVVHLSSLVVLRTAARQSTPIDEQSSLEPTPKRRGVYTRAKAVAEALARDAATRQDVVIVRPGLVFDAAAPLPLAVGWRRGRSVFLIGPADATLPVVYPEDVASGLMLAADRLSSGEVLHLVDPVGVSRVALLEKLAREGDERSRVVDVSGALLTASRIAAAMPLQQIANPAYRILSAGTPQRWSAAKAVGLGWRVMSRGS